MNDLGCDELIGSNVNGDRCALPERETPGTGMKNSDLRLDVCVCRSTDSLTDGCW
jgi:hypothetical protein